MTNFVNLTPHPITIQSNNNSLTIPPSGTVARVSSTSTQIATVTGIPYMDIPVFADTFGSVIDLPDYQPDTIYIVSGMVLNALTALPNKNHYAGWIVSPATGPNDDVIRDDQGRITAVTRLKGI